MKHTPGPWKFEENTVTRLHGEFLEISGKHGGIAFVDSPSNLGTNPGEWRAECEANARLIAAAPELLEALRALLPMAEAMHEVPATRANQARAAIDKAEGK